MKLILSILLLFTLNLSAQTETVTLKDYVDVNIEWSKRYNDAQLAAFKEANELVRLSLQEYKTVNNEWRGQLKDQAGTFVTWPALLSLIFGVAGLLFGYSSVMSRKREREERERDKSGSGKSIMSGDKVEVKK